MTDLLPCPFCGAGARFCGTEERGFVECMNIGCGAETGLAEEVVARWMWNRRAPVAVPAAAKPSTCCPGEHLVPMHSTDTKLCTGCKTEKYWPLEPGQKRTY